MGELVPLKRVTFSNGRRLYADLPRDTLDVRWRACIEHRFACDCREAEFAEDRAELRGQIEYIGRAFDEVLRGHATWGRNDFDQCQCTGCQIARRIHMRMWGTVENERREALGGSLPSPMPWTEDEVPF